MHDLTGFQRDLLYVIAGRNDPHGLAIREELEDYYEKEINHGRLYPQVAVAVSADGIVDSVVELGDGLMEIVPPLIRDIKLHGDGPCDLHQY